MVLNPKVTEGLAGSMSSRKVYTATGLPVSLLGKQWHQIPRGDGPNGSQSAGRGGGPALPAARVLGEELQNNPTQLAKYKHPSLNHREQVKSRKPESSMQETSKPA